MTRLAALLVLPLALLTLSPPARAADGDAAAKIDTATIDRLTGAKGQMNADEGVFKVTFPRADVKVTVDGTPMPPFMGLTTWAAFKPGMKDGALMVMGDVVLFQDEVSPAMSAALDNGLAVTALHNHFFFDEPRVYFMHIGGEGTADALAGGVRKVLDAVRDVRSKSAEPAKGFGGKPLAARSAVTAAPLADALGAKAAEKDGMAKFTIGRSAKMPCGCAVGKEMGVNTWAAFYGADDHALIDGDFATTDGELQPVLKALRKAGVNVVAIHSHMEGESPRVIFLHYWATGPSVDLAHAVRSALDAQAAVAARAANQH